VNSTYIKMYGAKIKKIQCPLEECLCKKKCSHNSWQTSWELKGEFLCVDYSYTICLQYSVINMLSDR